MAETREGAWALVEKGRQLWSSVASRKARSTHAAEAHAAVEVRLQVLESRAAGLEEEAVSSFEVVRSITEQHSQLAEHNARLAETVDALLARTRLLAWACAAAVCAATLALLAALLR
jgi:hypothetical protein